MSSSSQQTTKKGEGKKKGSPLIQFTAINSPKGQVSPMNDPDAPVPTVEYPDPSDQVGLEARLSALPFITNFDDIDPAWQLRFPNPCDVRNRGNWDRGASADPTKDPFETRILNNGLALSQAFDISDLSVRPPFFQNQKWGHSDHAQRVVDTYFEGVNPYPQFRDPPGQKNLFGTHYGDFLMTLYDAEGLLAQEACLHTDHALGLINWQLIDFSDLVFVVPITYDVNGEPPRSWRYHSLKDSQRFIVQVMHTPGHWVLSIFNRDTKRLGIIDTHPDRRTRDRMYPRIRDCVAYFLTLGLPEGFSKQACTAIQVKVTPQLGSTACGLLVATYVAFFFRENRGKNGWEFGDWIKTRLLESAPPGLPAEKALALVWGFAIRSEINGSGRPIRGVQNTPVISYDKYERLVAGKNVVYSQADILGMNKGETKYCATPGVGSEPGQNLLGFLTARFNKADLSRPTDVRTSRSSKTPVAPDSSKNRPPILTSKTPGAAVKDLITISGLGLHKDPSKTPEPLPQADGAWTYGEDGLGTPSEARTAPRTPDRSRAGTPQGDPVKLLSRQMSEASIRNMSPGGNVNMGGMTPERSGISRSSSSSLSSVPATPPPRRPSPAAMRIMTIQEHNRNASKWVGTEEANCWVPMPAISDSHQSWAHKKAAEREEKDRRPSVLQQNESRDERARNRELRRVQQS